MLVGFSLSRKGRPSTRKSDRGRSGRYSGPHSQMVLMDLHITVLRLISVGTTTGSLLLSEQNLIRLFV